MTFLLDPSASARGTTCTVNTTSSPNASAIEQVAGVSSDIAIMKQMIHAQQEWIEQFFHAQHERHEQMFRVQREMGKAYEERLTSTLEAFVKFFQAQVTSGRQDVELAQERPEAAAAREPTPAQAFQTEEIETPDVRPYYGARTKLEMWKNQLELKFRNEPLRFSTEEAKINYVGAILRGDAAIWLAAFFDKDKALIFKTSGEFLKAITKRFGDPDVRGTALRKLCALKQTGSVKSYTAEFSRLTTILGYDDKFKRDWIVKGLKRDIQWEIAIKEMPEDFDDFVNAMIRIDNVLNEYKASQGEIRTFNFEGSKNQARGSTNKTKPAMQPRAKRFSDE